MSRVSDTPSQLDRSDQEKINKDIVGEESSDLEDSKLEPDLNPSTDLGTENPLDPKQIPTGGNPSSTTMISDTTQTMDPSTNTATSPNTLPLGMDQLGNAMDLAPKDHPAPPIPGLMAEDILDTEDEDEYEDDLEEDENEVVDFNKIEGTERLAKDEQRELDQPGLNRKLSHTDANSLVGGEQLDGYNRKVFAFHLPFGGTIGGNIGGRLAKYKSNFYKEFQNQLSNFNFFNNVDEQITEDYRLKLQRQESLNTLKEADYFRHLKTRDDVRFRAVKHSLANKYNEMLPHKNSQTQKLLPDYESIYHKYSGNIVILGGYRGSVLRDAKTHKRIWVPFKAGFNLRKINLLLGPYKEDELTATQFLYPDGILKNIGPIDLCKSLIKKLSQNPNINLKEFGYDWRLNGEFSANKLVKFLEDIYEETGEPSLIICHSMGGLVTHRAVHKNPKVFKSIIDVGVPSECLNILGPIRTGESVLFLDKILTAEANFMMRSSFDFLPLSGKVFYNKDTHKPYVLDLFNPDTWVEYNLNPLVAKERLLKKLNTFLTNSSGSTILDHGINSISSRLRSIRARSPLSRSPKNKSPKSETFDLENESLPVPSSACFAKSPSPGSPLSASPNGISLHPDAMDEDTPNNSVANSKNSTLRSRNNSSSGETTIDEDGFSVTFEQAYEYLADSLKMAKEFILDLLYKPELEDKYPPMAIVYGNTVPSVRGSDVRHEQDIRDGNYYDFFYGHGDGVVHQKWLMPERKGYKVFDPETGKGQVVGKFATTTGHVNLMTDLKAMGKALNAIYEAEKIWNYN